MKKINTNNIVSLISFINTQKRINENLNHYNTYKHINEHKNFYGKTIHDFIKANKECDFPTHYTLLKTFNIKGSGYIKTDKYRDSQSIKFNKIAYLYSKDNRHEHLQDLYLLDGENLIYIIDPHCNVDTWIPSRITTGNLVTVLSGEKLDYCAFDNIEFDKDKDNLLEVKKLLEYYEDEHADRFHKTKIKQEELYAKLEGTYANTYKGGNYKVSCIDLYYTISQEIYSNENKDRSHKMICNKLDQDLFYEVSPKKGNKVDINKKFSDYYIEDNKVFKWRKDYWTGIYIAPVLLLAYRCGLKDADFDACRWRSYREFTVKFYFKWTSNSQKIFDEWKSAFGDLYGTFVPKLEKSKTRGIITYYQKVPYADS